MDELRSVTFAVRSVRELVVDDDRTCPSDELTEIALRTAFFGEPNPLGRMSFTAAAVNPLPQLAGLRLTEDSFEQVARLLVTEEVVSRLGASRVTGFYFRPPQQGVRE